MQLNDGTRLVLDWTFSGGAEQRADRLILTEDGYARRNHNGNLFTLVRMTAAEREQLQQLRARHARIDDSHHTGPQEARPSAWRLRLDGRGTDRHRPPLRTFAERVLGRLAHAVLLGQSDAVVIATVRQRRSDGEATLRVEKVLAHRAPAAGRALTAGTAVRARLIDARMGAGGAETVFVLTAPYCDEPCTQWRAEDCGYLKIKPAAAIESIGQL